MMQYLEKNLHQQAFEVACLGVTTKDWEVLALSALEAQKLDIARKAFIRTREFKYLNLISQFQDMKRQHNSTKPDIFLAFMHAYQSRFNEAAKCFKKAGQDQMAMSMFTDLRMFDQAKEYLGNDQAGGDKTAIMLKQVIIYLLFE